MVGRSVENFYPKESHGTDRVVLTLSGLTSAGHFADVDLQVHAGEVVGIGGVEGCGKGSLLRSPVRPAARDRRRDPSWRTAVLRLRSPRAAIATGVGYVTPDRQAEGLALQQSVSRQRLAGHPRLASSPPAWCAAGAERGPRRDHASASNITAPSVRPAGSALSGGNQQKVLLRTVAAEPTRRSC